nr:DNA adenine methylase [Anaerocolumna aminovalerica]
MKDVKFEFRDYKTLNPYGMLIYCDPPYVSNTQSTKQSYGVSSFDNDEFWNIMRKWSKNNNVYISEYIAPEDFNCVLEIKTQTSSRNGKYIYQRTEKLFTYNI